MQFRHAIRNRGCIVRVLLAVFLATPVNLQADESQKLNALIDSEWKRTLRESPTMASQLGDRTCNGFWSDQSADAIQKSESQTRFVLQSLLQIDAAQLSVADHLNYQLFRNEYETRVAEQAFRLNLIPLNQRGGIQDESNLANSLQFDSIRDYEDWSARLYTFPEYMNRTIALMQQGIAVGMLHPKVVIQRVPGQIRKQIVDNPEDSLYYAAFRTFKVELTEAQKTRLQQKAKTAIFDGIIPAYRMFLNIL